LAWVCDMNATAQVCICDMEEENSFCSKRRHFILYRVCDTDAMHAFMLEFTHTHTHKHTHTHTHTHVAVSVSISECAHKRRRHLQEINHTSNIHVHMCVHVCMCMCMCRHLNESACVCAGIGNESNAFRKPARAQPSHAQVFRLGYGPGCTKTSSQECVFSNQIECVLTTKCVLLS